MCPKFLLPLMLFLATSTVAQAVPASWNRGTLAKATFLVKDAQVSGNSKLVSDDQLKIILAAMKRDSQGALKRRYPGAKFTNDTRASGVIVVQPTLIAPSKLLPWAKLGLKYDLMLAEGTVTLTGTFKVMELYTQRAQAMNYAADRLMSKMP